mmetsp:Transcript_56451/g.93635  ORF Transcript_56451/g.93635 Transcript_56451/m.93635 type:complete len:160 (-) Transcript_56451:66-545(-)
MVEALFFICSGNRWPPLAPALAIDGGCANSPALATLAKAVAISNSAAMQRSAQGITAAADAAAAARDAVSELFGFSQLFKKSRKMRGVHGTFNPSIWRWYHRHGYWATRRKLIDFGTKRPHRYHQVVGAGKRGMGYANRFAQWWMDKSYYKPYKNYCRF